MWPLKFFPAELPVNPRQPLFDSGSPLELYFNICGLGPYRKFSDNLFQKTDE
jgi:hypothetical protein